ncbi:MAG: hypothetical protein ACJ76Y_08580 [Thermoanaerobaculia bacterium]
MRSMLVAVILTASLLASTPSGFQDRLWAFFSSLFDGTPAAQQLPTKAGCEMDPNGRCLSVSQPTLNAGCRRCKPPLPPGTKEGCNINPDGRCHS